MPMSPAALRRWSWLHKVSSLAGTVFLLLLCVTGLPLIFHEEIEQLVEDPPRPTGRYVAAGAAGPSLDDFIAHALAQGRGRHVNFVLREPGEPYVQVGTSDARAPARGAGHVHWFDGDTGAVLEPPAPAQGGFMDIMLRLHTDLYAGLPGTLFLGAMGLLLAVALVSGVALYGPFMRKLPFGTVRAGGAARTWWLDVHNLLGIATLAWLAVVGLTGTVNALEIPVGALWRQNDLGPRIQRHAGAAPAGEPAPLAAVLHAVRQAAPGAEPASIVFPGMSVSGPRHFLVISRGSQAATRHVVQASLVDGGTARVAEHVTMPWYVQALSLSQPLHFGDYGGLPLKLIWAALDVLAIVVLGSGLYLWVRKRAAPRRPPAWPR